MAKYGKYLTDEINHFVKLRNVFKNLNFNESILTNNIPTKKIIEGGAESKSSSVTKSSSTVKSKRKEKAK